MNLIMSIFLGIVQGVTEFLPISSSGHLSILQNLLNMDYSEEKHLLFEMLLHLGTLISICAVYRNDIRAMFSDGLEFLRTRNDLDMGDPVTLKPPARTLLFVLAGTTPMIIAAIFLYLGYVSRLFMSTAFVGFALIITGGILFVSDRYIQVGNKTEKNMTIRDAIIIGLAQAVAILPGLSRSGTTIAVGLASGLNKNYAVRFSLLLSIPAVLGGTIMSLFNVIKDGSDFSLLPVYLAGFVIAAVVGYFAIQLIRRLIANSGIGKFSYYCWGIGAITLVLSFVLK